MCCTHSHLNKCSHCILAYILDIKENLGENKTLFYMLYMIRNLNKFNNLMCSYYNLPISIKCIGTLKHRRKFSWFEESRSIINIIKCDFIIHLH